jgi:hypothetical protein
MRLMTAFAIAHLRSVDAGPDKVEYLERIDATPAAVYASPRNLKEPKGV